ncbi:hypothetical protein [Spiroplasma floricola]|uniref:Uncharacterized protein n=1 Tax=Spiroplasma floricola 23-6 TaxID=1336749 RepID=A0A2K8SCF8_9MOLU|nr:hypothetical protein [Spiroplasma floricola]AUB31144.1 hypothetical protein SFLOR_v1c00830 [Spiroplasma floricola 23-6]
MSKNLNNVFEISDMSKFELKDIKEILDKGQTILMALEKGEHVSNSLAKGFSDYLNAYIELKEEKENCGICGCGKPANILVYIWK